MAPTETVEHQRSKNLYCCVAGCCRKLSTHPHLKFHPFPKKGAFSLYVINESDVETKMDLRELWEMILLMKKPASAIYRVCSLHFQRSDYYGLGPNKSFLKLHPSAFPTLKLPQKPGVSKTCMVESCQSRSDEEFNKAFFTLDTPLTEFQTNRYLSWRRALGNCGTLNAWSPLTVCSDHFVSRRALPDPKSVDFVPSLNLPTKFQIEEVNVSGNCPFLGDATSQDPLQLAEPEFVAVDGIFEDCVKIEPEEVVEMDHCYC